MTQENKHLGNETPPAQAGNTVQGPMEVSETSTKDVAPVKVVPGREYYWKRTEGWQWRGRERWWQVFVVFADGMNGAGGAWITEIWRWNGSSEDVHRVPRNLSYEETQALLGDLWQNHLKTLEAA